MKMIPGKWYYVSDDSNEAALRGKMKRKFIKYSSGTMFFEHNLDSTQLVKWRYAVQVEEDKV